MAVRSSSGSSSDRSRGRFDAFRLARDRDVLEGSVDATTLPRLEEQVCAPADVGWRIEGAQDSQGRPAVQVILDGEVTLTCQRCLSALAWPVKQRTLLVLARDDADLARLDADSDDEVVLAAGSVDPAQLVEEELVLALPYAPRHAEGECPMSPQDG